jgi:hypothetical protein
MLINADAPTEKTPGFSLSGTFQRFFFVHNRNCGYPISALVRLKLERHSASERSSSSAICL